MTPKIISPRFIYLIDDIKNQAPNSVAGVKDKWISSAKHSELFDKRFQYHEDKGGWNWHKENEAEYKKGTIILFKIKNRKWFVMPGSEADFLIKYPGAKKK